MGTGMEKQSGTIQKKSEAKRNENEKRLDGEGT